MDLKPDQKIDIPEWMRDARVVALMKVIGGQNQQSLFVGGCVRNTLLNKAVQDIDIATQLTPDEVIEKLNVAQIKVIPTGIKHGTVTAVIEGKSFEITTLRHDLKTDGRHAEVSFMQSWVEDAKRRDFTMNSLYADMDGNIYDPTGQGLKDLKVRKIRFVGEASQRIAEDYLRILRYFRFHAYYGLGDMDHGALDACKAAADQISSLSKERITQEFLKILAVDNCADILKIMFDYNVLSDLADKNYQEDVLQKLCDLQENEDNNLMPRLFVLAGNKARLFDGQLMLTHAQKNFLIKLEMAFNPAFYADEKALKKAIFYHGNALLLQGYWLLVANKKIVPSKGHLDILKNWQAPECPITGETLIAEGYVTGPDLGQELARRQEEWLESKI